LRGAHTHSLPSSQFWRWFNAFGQGPRGRRSVAQRKRPVPAPGGGRSQPCRSQTTSAGGFVGLRRHAHNGARLSREPPPILIRDSAATTAGELQVPPIHLECLRTPCFAPPRFLTRRDTEFGPPWPICFGKQRPGRVGPGSGNRVGDAGTRKSPPSSTRFQGNPPLLPVRTPAFRGRGHRTARPFHPNGAVLKPLYHNTGRTPLASPPRGTCFEILPPMKPTAARF